MKKTAWLTLLVPLCANAGFVMEDELPKRIPAPVVAPAAKPQLQAKAELASTVGQGEAPTTQSPPPGVKRWEVRVQDITLNKTMERWAEDAGYRVRWDAKKHILVEAPDVFVGTFEQALKQALGSPGVLHGDYPLEVCIYPNSPLLARVTRQGEQVRECPEAVTE